MVDRESNSQARGQEVNSRYEGPGCNGRFEAHEVFYKFLHPKVDWSWKEDRPSTAVFRDLRESVSWGALATPSTLLNGREDYGLLSVNTGLCVDLYQTIKYTPNVPGYPNTPAHCDIVGEKPRKVAREFARRACKLVRPEKPQSSGAKDSPQ